MAIIAELPRSLGLADKKVDVVSGTGPASNTTVNAGTAGTIAVPITSALGTVEASALSRVSGLPDGVVVNNVSISRTAVTLTVYNATTSNVTVAANSVTASAILIGY